MTSARTWGFTIAASALVLVAVLLAVALPASAARPGNPEAGRKIFKEFCAPCHDFRATRSVATLARKEGVAGADLDVIRPSYSWVVTAVVQGEGGIEAEYFLNRLTFKQICDVAAFVSRCAGKVPKHAKGLEPARFRSRTGR